jgi:cobalt-zinc-cadmium efflux system membrane fusion protein
MRASLLMALFVFLLAACSQQGDELANDVAGLEPVAYTLYSEKSELFVEFRPLIVGKISGFAAHFTVLGKSFSPLEEGKVTVSLITGENGIRNVADSASSPGIFRLSLEPLKPGKSKLVFDIVTKDFTDQIVINDITVYPDGAAALAQQKISDVANDISFLKEQAWNIDFANEPVRRTNFREILKSSGQVLAAPGDETVITANSSGAILFASNKTMIGSTLNVGDHLFTISGGNLAQENPEVYYKETKAKYELAKVEFERAEILVKDKIISQKDYLQSKLEFENMQASFQAVSKNYSASGQKVTSNSTGFLKNLLVSEGQYVEPGTPLAIISKNKKALLQANVSQKYFQKLAAISSANFKIVNDESVFNTEEMNGKVISYGKSTSENASYIPITFEINNIGNIIPGSVAEVFLKSNTIPDALIIPISALMEELGNFFVFVQTGGETFEKREIKLGGNDGRHVQVLSGLKEGERVVTKGAYAIKLASASGAIPEHGHSH